ncbi:MAG: biotin synthase BioB [Planctomycetota bacterium]
MGTTITRQYVDELFSKPLLELVFTAATVHREYHDPRRVQRSQLISIKTGGCPEDCGYCSQSARYAGGAEKDVLMATEAVLLDARRAREEGAERFCMGAAWRSVRDGEEFDRVIQMVRGVKELGLEACATLGMLSPDQALRLEEAGLDYYNHNIDTGRSHYEKVVSTHGYDDRLKTLQAVRDAGIKVCCGGILGIGETRSARAEMVFDLATMDPVPESIPINQLVPIEGTPMASNDLVDWTEVVRTIAVARICIPKTWLRLSAGRRELGEAAQAMCFMAGANSMFVGDKLLTTDNPAFEDDRALMEKLGMLFPHASKTV